MLFVGPLKSKEHCKYFRIINWILVVFLFVILFEFLVLVILDKKVLKTELMKPKVALLVPTLILQIYVVRIMHGMCRKSLINVNKDEEDEE
jgi:uncharacterized membrane protein (DUF485 family)